ncbi:MAG TPA: STAS domain-containing protein [Solirubrobacteraceae bacterium]|nr:STAS domain-containing protein [Solirubrobacteraceae bacterium]
MFRRHPPPRSRTAELAGAEEFTIRCERERDRYVVAPSGELDTASAWRLERELRRVEASDASEIVLDLSAVEFIDSTGLQPVLHANARAEFHSKRLMIVPGPAAVQRCFEISGLASRLPFVDRGTLAPHV